MMQPKSTTGFRFHVVLGALCFNLHSVLTHDQAGHRKDMQGWKLLGPKEENCQGGSKAGFWCLLRGTTIRCCNTQCRCMDSNRGGLPAVSSVINFSGHSLPALFIVIPLSFNMANSRLDTSNHYFKLKPLLSAGLWSREISKLGFLFSGQMMV